MNEEMFPDEESPVIGPGRLLQLAREEKNLRPEDVAYEIRLTPTQVIALEEDDYSSMPEPTYVRGYLRNYARLVGVPENDILMSFARITRGHDDKPKQVTPTVEKEINKGGKGSKYLALATVLVIIVISAVWVVIEPVKQDDTPGEIKPGVVAEKGETMVSDEVPVGSTTLDLAARESAPAQPPVDEQPAVEQPQQDTAGAVAGREEAPVAIKQAQEEATEAVSNGNDGTLILSYSKDSWTDIRDVNGNKLLYRTVKAGENVAVSGELPISLFFGFAQGVKVSFNGKEINIAEHTRGVFARFTVGETPGR